MALTPEWRARIERWKNCMETLFYRPLQQMPMEALFTFDQLTIKQAEGAAYKPVVTGQLWGRKWEYAWFRTRVRVPAEARGERLVMKLDVGPEAAIAVNGSYAGASDQWHRFITLAHKAVPGKSYRILAEAYGGHGPHVCGVGPVPHGVASVPEPGPTQNIVKTCEVGIWEEEMFQLWLDTETLWQVRDSIDPESLRVQEIDRALREMTLTVDLELPRAEMLKTVRKGRRILKPLLESRNGPTIPTMYCFGHSHIDVAWLWPLRETESKCTRTLGTALALMREYPEYRFLQSQPHLYWMVKEKYPDLYREIQAAVKRGQLIPEGGMWVEADTNITGGESLIRQFIHGKRFFRDEFGVECQLLWLPDVFGYSGALPQLMKGCGVDYFSTSKIFWIYGGGYPFPYNSFWWEGIDGTRIFAHFHNNYNSLVAPANVVAKWGDRRQKDGMVSLLYPFGFGDGGGGPTREHLEFLRRQTDLEGVPRTVQCSPIEFFKDDEQRPDGKPVYVGELYFQNHRGTYTSQARTKRGNRRSELALRETELWASASSVLHGHTYPRDDLRRLWQDVLLNQFHDIIPGSSIARVYEQAEEMYDGVLSAAKDLTDRAARKLLRASRDRLTVFNSLSWDRTALVPLPAAYEGARDEAGNALPVQLIDGTPHAEVTDIPSCGWVTIKRGPARQERNTLKASTRLLENEFLRVRINTLGEVTGIYDKASKRELAAAPCNSLHMYKDVPTAFDAWDINSMYKLSPVDITGPTDITVKEEGPLAAALRVVRTLHNSRLEQTIRLRRGSRRLDFITTVDWQEKHKLLKVNFPVNLRSDEAIHEIQFGHLSRPTHASNQLDADRFEVCNQKWTALSENSHGVAVMNDCKYGVSVEENSINLTLLKSPVAPDMHADRGKQEFTYSFYAWNGSFADSPLVREAYELNVPVRTLPGAGERTSLLRVDAPNIIIETVKGAEDDSGDVIVRLYESKRMHTDCTLKTGLPAASAALTNMIEDTAQPARLRNGSIKLTFRPFEIKTVRLSMGQKE